MTYWVLVTHRSDNYYGYAKVEASTIDEAKEKAAKRYGGALCFVASMGWGWMPAKDEVLGWA